LDILNIRLTIRLDTAFTRLFRLKARLTQGKSQRGRRSWRGNYGVTSVGIPLISVPGLLYRAYMTRQRILRILFLRLSAAGCCFAIGVWTFALWPSQHSIKIDRLDVGSGNTTPIVSPGSKSNVAISSTPNSPIRSIDFENFTYPEISARGTFSLKDGHEPNVLEPRGLVDVIYGDVTSDGLEEARVVHSQSIKGSAIPFFVYVYALSGTKPRLLWSFDAGERGDGGMRQIFAFRGKLVVELYGRDRIVNGGTSSTRRAYTCG
jgi:hypothetical protein